MRIDGDEQAPAAGQHFVFGIQNLGHVDVAATANAHLARFDAQRLVEWDRLKVVHGDLRGQRDYVAQLIYLAHRVVKDGSDHASVDVARRARVAFAEAEAADEAVLLFVKGEFQTHAVGVIPPASEAVILLHLDVAGVVIVSRFLRHGSKVIKSQRTISPAQKPIAPQFGHSLISTA